ncbi:MAG: hypothetical protein NC102_06515 [Clostridium sp.]|nr:hypothetical protein [Clostridium sp.]
MVLGLMFGACNGDIFVEPVPDPEVDTFYLDCDGKEASFNIHTKGVTGLRFDCANPELAFLEFYDSNGEILYSPTFENVDKVVYSSPLFYISFDIDGSQVRATALDNTTQNDVAVWVTFDYEHATRTYNFVIAPGRPLEITNFSYFISDSKMGGYEVTGMPRAYSNNSDRDARVSIYPYKEWRSRIQLLPDAYDNWGRGTQGSIRLPAYTGEGWSDRDTETVEITIGEPVDFYSQNVNAEEAYSLVVPAQSKVSTVTEVNYATIEMPCNAYLAQPGSGDEYLMQGKFLLMHPISYKIYEQ